MRSIVRFLALTALLVTLAAGAARAQIGPGPFAAFPSGDTTDARFMGFACADLATLEGKTSIGMEAPADTTDFLINVFDGETGKLDFEGKAHWDNGTRQLRYSLYADPLRTGTTSPANLIGSWTGNDPNPTSGPFWVSSAAEMPDNDWWAVQVTNAPLAQAPSGNYFYNLVIEFAVPCTVGDTTEANVKIAASNPMNFNVPSFGLVAPLRQLFNDGPIVYPGPVFPPAGNDFIHAPTTYDGSFEFFLSVPDSNADLRIFDGDLDHGTGTAANSLTGSPGGGALVACADTDDPDTDILYTGFPFAVGAALAEGAAGAGNPTDDNRLDIFRRGEIGDPNRNGCIRYEVSDPNGNVYRDDNPSGNREWEQFRIATAAASGPADVVVPGDFLPSGTWKVKTVGQDLSNLTQWFVDACAGRLSESGGVSAACASPGVYLLGDTVFYDLNSNGVQDSGEPGIKGVKVELLGLNGDPIRSVLTGDASNPNWAACVAHNTGLDTNGLYCLGADLPGLYTVRVSPDNFGPGGLLEGATVTTPGGNQISDAVVADNVLTYDFGYIGSSALGDYVWYDANADSVQDEPVSAGLAGVTVNLREAGADQFFDSPDDLVFPPQVTDADGKYLFDHLLKGFYRVDVDETTLPIPGMTNTTGNDPLETPLGGGEIFLDADFGWVLENDLGSIGDTVWTDTNADGTINGTETGIDGVTVNLAGDLDGDGDADLVKSTVTASGGLYSFGSLPAGSYTVTVDDSTLPPGLSPTYDLDGIGTPHTAVATLAAAEDRTDVDFGYRMEARSNSALGDRVWLDGNGNTVQDPGEGGINGVTVELLDNGNNVVASAVTVGDGNYGFTNLSAGTYSVRIVTATLPPAVAQTYDFDGTGTPHIATVTLGDDETNNNVDFGYRGTASLGDRVWNDIDGDGVQDGGPETGFNGVTVRLLDGSNNVLSTTVTAGDGNYTFSNLNAGTYKVQVDATTLPAGFNPTYDLDGIGTAHIATATLNAGQNRVDVDFGYRGSAALGDRVWLDFNGDGVQDGGETGINGVTVRLLDNSNNVLATQVTSGDGNYHFTHLAAGTYKVQVDTTTLPAGLAQTFDADGTGTANIATVSVTAGQVRDDVDFGYRGTAALGDRVWLDFDADGVQDSGETGINGVTVRLLNSANVVISTQVTSGDGNYNFVGLAAGTYTVQVDSTTLPAGLVQTFDIDGPGTANIATVTLNAGQVRNDVDFGYRGSASLGDRVWNDANGNGVQEGTETGLNGVTVRLLNSSNAVIATTVTSGNGNYTFANLPAGTYKVQVDSTTLPAGYTQTFDLDGTGTAHIATATLTAGQTRTDVDFGYKAPAACTPDSFTLSGSSAGSGTVGNIRTFTSANGVQLHASAFSRKDSTGVWSAAYLGAFSGGLGVTTTAEGSGGNDTHTIDNIGGEHDYVLLELNAPVVLNQAFLGYIATAAGFGPDSDISVWIGNKTNPFTSHNTLSDAFLSSLGAREDNDTTATTTRWADVNAANVSGNVIVIAASTYDSSPEDGFKLNKLALDCPGTPPVTYSVGDRVWSDTDGDGVQDGTETGLNGVTVELLNSGGTVIATQTTSGNGNYTFTGLTAGTYKVRVVTTTLPSGSTQTYDLDGTGTANIATFTLNANRTDVDFGYKQPVCVPGTFSAFSGNDSVSGTAGNIKTFTHSNGTKVKVSAWSRKKSTGAWAPAYLGAYGGGLGVTDSVSDGNGSNNQHTTDNNGSADNYLLFEFDRDVIADQVSLGYVVTDSDLTAWFGDAPGGVNPFTTHQTLSTSFLSGLATETNGGGSSARTANVNAGNVAGNVLIVAAKTDGTNNTTTDFSNDYFKLQNLTLACPASPNAPGTGTLGFWKTHPEDWPVESITIGGTTYTKADAIAKMSAASSGDKTKDLFKQLVAAKLNVMVGNESSCISATIVSADAWMASHPYGSGVSASSTAWQQASGWHTQLDDYNNGLLCAPHRN